jgi:hypothetical protein
MPNVVDKIGTVISWSGDTYRLIPSRFPPVAVYEGLVANDRLEALATVENLTNPRLVSEARIANSAGEDPKTSARLQNWNLAPFAYGNPEGSTFFDEERPCLEIAADRQTALAISVAKRQRFLERTAEPPVGLDMRMFKTPVTGNFVDLRSLDALAVQSRGRQLADNMPENIDGILFHPIERPTATAISVMNGLVLGRTLQTVHYRYVWNGERISQVYAFDEAGSKIEPANLQGEEDCLAA